MALKFKNWRSNDNKVSRSTISVMSVGMMVLSLVLAYLLYKFLPGSGSLSITILWMDIAPSAEARLVLLALIAGALGSFVHMAHSFATYVGLQKVKRSWLWWYGLRPFIGMVLALIFYLGYRAGNFGGTTAGSFTDADLYGMLVICALVGMFSKQAVDKLADVFDNLLLSKQGEALEKVDSVKTTTDKAQVADNANPQHAAITSGPEAVG